jgi:hypothetical protein
LFWRRSHNVEVCERAKRPHRLQLHFAMFEVDRSIFCVYMKSPLDIETAAEDNFSVNGIKVNSNELRRLVNFNLQPKKMFAIQNIAKKVFFGGIIFQTFAYLSADILFTSRSQKRYIYYV